MYIHEIKWPILIFSTPSLRFQYVYLHQHIYTYTHTHIVWNENKKKRTVITIRIKWKTDNIAAQKKKSSISLSFYNSLSKTKSKTRPLKFDLSNKLINQISWLCLIFLYDDDYTNSRARNRIESNRHSSHRILCTNYLYSQRT